jgi:7-alpha-hydroxysteroid dehydrogenase
MNYANPAHANENTATDARSRNAMSDDFSLKGKVALVTGSGRGIGAAIAHKFARAGASVVVTGRTAAQIEDVASQINAAGGRALAVAIDFNKVEQFAGLIEQITGQFGGLDIIVNNAGGARSPSFVDTRIEHLNTEFHLIVAAPFELCRLALPHLLKRPGASITNIIGPGAYIAPRGNLSYFTGRPNGHD